MVLQFWSVSNMSLNTNAMDCYSCADCDCESK